MIFHILDSADMGILYSHRNSQGKVFLMHQLLNSTKIWCLTLNLKKVVVIGHLFPLAHDVIRNMMENVWQTQIVDFV